MNLGKKKKVESGSLISNWPPNQSLASLRLSELNSEKGAELDMRNVSNENLHDFRPLFLALWVNWVVVGKGCLQGVALKSLNFPQ